MFIINHRKIFFTLSAILVLGSIFIMFTYGFNFGIDFKGGSLLEVGYVATRLAPEIIKSALDDFNLGAYILTPSGNLNYVLKTKDLNPGEKVVVLSAFQQDPTNPAKEERFNSHGPVVGERLHQATHPRPRDDLQ